MKPNVRVGCQNMDSPPPKHWWCGVPSVSDNQPQKTDTRPRRQTQRPRRVFEAGTRHPAMFCKQRKPSCSTSIGFCNDLPLLIEPDAFQGAFIYEFGDHGGLIVMADDLKKTGEASQAAFACWCSVGNEGMNLGVP